MTDTPKLNKAAYGGSPGMTCSSRFVPRLGIHDKSFWRQAEDYGFSWRPEQKGQALRLLDMQRNLAALEKSGLLTEREACTIGMRLRRKIDALNMQPNDSHRCSLCRTNDERVHHYQRGRASITGWRLKLG